MKKRYKIVEVGIIKAHVFYDGPQEFQSVDLHAQYAALEGIAGQCAIYEQTGRNPPEILAIWERSA